LIKRRQPAHTDDRSALLITWMEQPHSPQSYCRIKRRE
jgi:hypothetical protein